MSKKTSLDVMNCNAVTDTEFEAILQQSDVSQPQSFTTDIVHQEAMEYNALNYSVPSPSSQDLFHTETIQPYEEMFHEISEQLTYETESQDLFETDLPDEVNDPDYDPKADSAPSSEESESEYNQQSIHQQSNNITEQTPEEIEKTQPGISTGRKRIRDEAQWKQNLRKRYRNEGRDYTTRNGKRVKRKHLEDKPCGCLHRKCNEIIPFSRRVELFSNFWKLGNWTAQNTYILGLIKLKEVKRRDDRDRRNRRTKEGPIKPKKTPKECTREYNIPNESGLAVVVCKQFFLGTFGISNGRLTRALEKFKKVNGPQTDMRGRKTPKNKTPDHKIENLVFFLNKIPKYESHYCRENGKYEKSGYLYFSPGLTLSKIYSLYNEDCMKNSKEAVSDFVFRKTLKEKFKVKIHAPLKDTCKSCDLSKAQIDVAKKSNNIERVNHLEKEKKKHHDEAQFVRDQLMTDLTKEKTKVICFDLQKTLPTPVLTTGLVYYKRQLWTYNLGVHDEASGEAIMHMWHEGQGSRGPNEIGSCLLKYVTANVNEETLIAYTDTCGGQNRNIKLSLFWLYIVSNHSSISVVDQKFFVSGHSYMSCDRDFGIIENKKSAHPYIFVPEHWVDLVNESNKKFQVQNMSEKDLVHVENLLKTIVHRKVDTLGEKVQWLKIRWLQFRKTEPFKIFFKYSLAIDCPFRCLDIERKRLSRDKNVVMPSMSEPLPLLYPHGHAIKKAKYDDLQKLLPFIPPIHHDFFIKLVHTANVGKVRSDDDNDIFEIEDEIEDGLNE